MCRQPIRGYTIKSSYKLKKFRMSCSYGCSNLYYRRVNLNLTISFPQKHSKTQEPCYKGTAVSTFLNNIDKLAQRMFFSSASQ